MTSVHDNWLYAQSVDHERGRLVLHTAYPHVAEGRAPEWTDVIFEGVIAFRFEELRCATSDDPACVLFDVEERDAARVLAGLGEPLARLRLRGWPLVDWTDLDDLVAKLGALGVRCFAVEGVCGVEGFVLARSMELRARADKARVGEG